MNILFTLYGDLNCNSATHVDALARQLCALGCACWVAVPTLETRRERFEPFPYRVSTFQEVLEDPCRFSDGRGPDVFHAWTPREVNRMFHDELAQKATFVTVIHFEDNEWHLTECHLGNDAHRRWPDTGFPPGPVCLFHPVHGAAFLDRAAGFSLINQTLSALLPPGKRHTWFWPAADAAAFYPRPRNDDLRRELRIPRETCMLAYPGNVHRANAREVRSLYLAVALLNRAGVPAKLIRLGRNFVRETVQQREWADTWAIDMGFVPDGRIPEILAAADVFVQPGSSNRFNDYRFPSKLPEFFALGRPVILPRTNIGTVTRHLQDAYVMEEGDGPGIADAVAYLWSRPELREQLARGAVRFGAEHLSWAKAGRALMSFYRTVADAGGAGQATVPAAAA